MEFDLPLRVALVNESELVRSGLTAMLAEHAERVTIVGEGDPVSETDITLVDPYTCRSAGPSGVEVTRTPGLRIAVFSWETRVGFVEQAMLGGADGYLSKALPSGELVAALEKVHAGERIVAVAELRHRHDPPHRPVHEVILTPRETDVVSLIAAGAPNKEICERLELSMNTVKSHIRTAYRSMGVTSRTQAVLWAVERGITAHRVPPEPPRG